MQHKHCHNTMGSSQPPRASWGRKPVSGPIRPEIQSLTFQLVDIDHYNTNQTIWMASDQASHVPVTRMFGLTRDGHSVLCHVHGFFPYFYVYIDRPMETEELLEVQDRLEQMILPICWPFQDNLFKIIVALENVTRKSLIGFSEDEEQHFIKITVALPGMLGEVVEALKQMAPTSPLGTASQAYSGLRYFETDIDYELRFMVDSQLSASSWLQLPPRMYRIRSPTQCTSHCQLECDIKYGDFIVLPQEGEWLMQAPLRILSFDIECRPKGKNFRDGLEEVIQIGNTVVEHGNSGPPKSCIFTIGSCAAIEGAAIMSYPNEKEMLQAWAQFFTWVDPDIIVGYNIKIFDINYLLKRARLLNLNELPYLGRIRNPRSMSLEEPVKEGKPKNLVFLEGRIQLDLFLVLRRDYELQVGYKLNSVSRHFLEDQKEDVEPSQIGFLQDGDQETRRRLAVYCLKDTLLPLKILDKLILVDFYLETAKVTGVPLRYAINRGPKIRALSMLLRKSSSRNYLLPPLNLKEGGKKLYREKLESGGFFSSLMGTHNICYSTLLLRARVCEVLGLREGPDYFETGASHFFVKPNVRRGLVPEILDDLHSAHRATSFSLSRENNPGRRILLSQSLLAIKIIYNSVYGLTATKLGILPWPAISDSVIDYARELKELLEEGMNNSEA